MMGTFRPCASSPATIAGSAAAAASVLTVTRTSSEPARASAAVCRMVPATSAVSVLVIDCTTIGCEPPTFTPLTSTTADCLRSILAIQNIPCASDSDSCVPCLRKEMLQPLRKRFHNVVINHKNREQHERDETRLRHTLLPTDAQI